MDRVSLPADVEKAEFMRISSGNWNCRRAACAGLSALLVCLTGLVSQTLADPPSSTTVTPLPPDVQKLVRQLSCDSFKDRVAAQQQLTEYTQQHPQQLAMVIPEIPPEAQLRLVRILEESFLEHADQTGDNAERALDEVRETDAVAAVDAAGVLAGNARLRESRARVQIERLGGRLAYVHPTDGRSPPTAPLVGVGFGEPSQLQTILISEDWSGTPDDLWHFRRLSHHRDLMLYNIRSNHLTMEDLLPLASDLPGLNVAERGGCLGIRGGSNATAMQVSDVVENSAAEAADLRPNDVIEYLDDHRVRNFSHLVELLLLYAPGDVVKLKVNRNEEVLTIPVTLASWRTMPLTDQPPAPTPADFAGPLGQARPRPPALPEDAEPEPSPHLHLE
ncbi:PDZ domain-containing protein [Planctomicrobium piriforme]|uniref:PDZ domain-containing protein n=1 Tax=Planctomicrobium piriforme TaxID=1576369 RepID=A0A1I3PF04_9PLAN|nr:PDZ domain-containing protein [Planctomicrobium piriforme]SFJ20072.1 PDZ domain-containing protein [Planctomicrobium piriforme]